MKRIFAANARQLGTLAVLLVLGATITILTPYFLTVPNLLNVAQQTVINAIVAVGMTFVIISAGIDLSVGSILAVSGVVMASAIQSGTPERSAASSLPPIANTYRPNFVRRRTKCAAA